MISGKETIHHFVCDHCNGWWSIATSDDWCPVKWSHTYKGKYKSNIVRKMYCPWCGEGNEITGVSNGS